MDNNEKIKKILGRYSYDYDGWNVLSTDAFGDVAKAICQLFPKSADNPDGFKPKPDEGKLLTPKEIGISIANRARLVEPLELSLMSMFEAVAKAQDAKTAPLAFSDGYTMGSKDSEMESKEEERATLRRIKRELEEYKQSDNDTYTPFIFSKDEWQEFWKKEGVKDERP